MPLPFLKDDKKLVPDVITSKRQSDSEESQDFGHLAASQDLIDAIHSKDAKAVSEALKASRELLDAPAWDDAEGDEE
jgi:hypothetical protein